MWDPTKLEIGQIFYGVSYFKVKSVSPGEIECLETNQNNRSLIIGRKIVEKAMLNASVYDSVEKVTRTDLYTILKHSNTGVLTVNWNCKPKPEEVQ